MKSNYFFKGGDRERREGLGDRRRGGDRSLETRLRSRLRDRLRFRSLDRLRLRSLDRVRL